MRIEVVADRDDDDADGVPDAEESYLPPEGRVDLVALPRALAGFSIRPIHGAEHVRVLSGGRPLPWGAPLPLDASLEGVTPGRMIGVLARGSEEVPLEVGVFGVGFYDGTGARVDLARSHASVERNPPARAEGGWDGLYADKDALRLVVERESDREFKGVLSVESVNAKGEHLDVLDPALGPAACHPAALGFSCEASLPLRFVADEVDRQHALVRQRSLLAELGGAVVVRRGGKKVQAIRVLGPRTSSVGPIGRLRALLRPMVVRVAPGGAPAIGGSEAGAVAALRAELGAASAIWGQCGVTFGDLTALEVKIVDPPPPHLLSIGDDVGLPAEGGEIELRIDARRTVRVVTRRGETPASVAIRAALAVEDAGFEASVSPNVRIGPGADGSVDVSVRRRGGRPVPLDPVSHGVLSTDPRLSVRIGFVDLSDGLQHFGDVDSVAGTLEERTLVKAVDDGDPSTIEILVIPFFAGGGRIGESFIGSDLSSVRNVVILDRAGIRARRSSLTLAHELGHVLLDLPGHPDDYGVDTPTLLMDSDASDASPFGPKRLAVEECARAVREAGPKGRVPLLVDWPLTRLAYPPYLPASR
jgi:hypothetical protein